MNSRIVRCAHTVALLVAMPAAFPVWSVAQTPTILWQRSYGGSRDDVGYAVAQTRDSGFVVVGRSMSSNGDVTRNHGFVGAATDDYWIAKLDPMGAIKWRQSLGGSGNDAAYSVAATNDGGCIVVGESTSMDGDVNGKHGPGGDEWIIKFDAGGAVQWKKCYGGSAEEAGFSVSTTNDGGYIVSGVSSSNDGDVIRNHGFNRNGDYWVVKLDGTGAIVWQQALGGSNVDAAYSAVQTRDGGYATAGVSWSVDGDGGSRYGYSDCWIVRFDARGAVRWRKSYGGSGFDAAHAIVETKDGGLVVAGYSSSRDGDVTGHHGFGEATDYWVFKLDSTGTLLWEKSLGGTGNDVATSLVATPDGGFVVAGSSTSTDGDVTDHHGDSKNADYWLVKIDSVGNILWTQSLGGHGFDGYNVNQADVPTPRIAATNDGIIIAGGSNSRDGDVTENHGGFDFWVVRLAMQAPCAASATFSLPADSARVGDTVAIALNIDQSHDLNNCGGQTISWSLRYDRSLLVPIDTVNGIDVGFDRILSFVSTRIDTIGPLATVRFIATLGDADRTTLHLESLDWTDGTVTTATGDGSFTLTNVCNQGGKRYVTIGDSTSLAQNAPNPFTDATAIEYNLLQRGQTTVRIVDVLGRTVQTVVNEEQSPGHHRVAIRSSEFPAGVYRCVLQTPERARSVVMMKCR